jgi:hypothetical protein
VEGTAMTSEARGVKQFHDKEPLSLIIFNISLSFQ